MGEPAGGDYQIVEAGAAVALQQADDQVAVKCGADRPDGIRGTPISVCSV
jgi:hypothetical protein